MSYSGKRMKYLFILSTLTYLPLGYTEDLSKRYNASLDFFGRLEKIEDKLSCREQYYKDEESDKDSQENVKNYLGCVDSVFDFSEDRIFEKNEDYRVGVQIFLSDSKEKAEDIVNNYNRDKANIAILKNSIAEYIYISIEDKSILKNGLYYKIIVFQNGVEPNILLKNIHEIYKKNYLDAFIEKVPIK